MKIEDYPITNNYTTKSEQILLDLFKDNNTIISTEELKNIFPKKEINQHLSNLTKKGHIIRLKRSHYILKETFLENPYKFISTINKGVICFISALRIHNLIDYEPNTIFVMTDSISSKKKILNYNIHYINLKHKIGIEEKNNIKLTDIEKTIIDCLFKPEYAGSYSNIIKAIKESNINWEKIIEYLNYYNKQSLFQKLGFIIMKTNKKVPQDIIKFLKSKIKNKVRILSNQKLKTKYNKEWMIMENLGNQKWN
jgi:predicted transcriptional regulator of viral defense system